MFQHGKLELADTKLFFFFFFWSLVKNFRKLGGTLIPPPTEHAIFLSFEVLPRYQWSEKMTECMKIRAKLLLGLN